MGLFSKSRTAVAEQPRVSEIAIVGSVRSQRSLLEETRLQRALAKISMSKMQAEKKLAEFEEEKKRRAAQLIGGPLMSSQAGFNDACAQCESASALIAACDTQAAEIKKQIASLSPTPEQAHTRAEEQRKFATLAAERLEKARSVYRLTGMLREILSQHDELTGKMQEIARSLDLTANDEAIDGLRFERLSNSLPREQLSASQEWFDFFVGGAEKPGAYVVIDEQLQLPETLASAGLYHFGDRISLPRDEAAELLRADRPWPTPKIRDLNEPSEDRPRWQKRPPSIMTVEEYEAIQAKAGERGIDPEWYLSMRHSDELRKAKMAHEVSTTSAYAKGGYQG